MVGYGLFSLSVIHKEDLCPRSGDLIRLMMMNCFSILLISLQLNIVNDEVPTKLSLSVKKAELNSEQIESFKSRSDVLKVKVEDFLQRTEPLRLELDKRFLAINRLENVLMYLKSFEKIDELR
jgi:hypothetical protein